MKKKIICLIIILISLLVMCTSISINETTIKNARDRILEELYTEEEPVIEEQQEEQAPTEEELAEGETGEVIEEDKTNSYNNKELVTIIISTTLFVVAFVTIIFTTMTLFNAIKLPPSVKVLTVYTIIVIILASISIITLINYTDKNFLNGKSFEVETLKKEQSLYVVNKSSNDKNIKLISKNNNETVLKITNEATYNAQNLNLTKTDGKLSNIKDNKNKGLNNVLVINKGSIVSIKNSNITSKNDNSSAIYTTGLNTLLDLDNVNINTSKKNSSALVAKNSSEINIKNSKINTTGINSSIFNVESTITADNVTATTNSEIATIFKTNVLSITNSEIKTNLTEEKDGIFTIKTNNNDDSYETASLTVENSNIKVDTKSKYYKTTPLFSVYNTNLQINLTNNKFTYGAKNLINVVSKENSSLKTTTLTITDSTLKGNITADKFSKVRFNINNSVYTGSINSKNESQYVDITFDKTSKWNLTGHSYVNTITFQNQNNIRKYINSNGYNIYCNAKNNEWLGNKTITLPGGGKLIPIS